MAESILVVEDDEAIRESVAELLETENYTVFAAENGQEALDLLRARASPPALILLDLMMPVMDGVTFCEEKSRDALLASIPVVLMSADSQIRHKLEKTRAQACIRKPVDIDALLDVVKRHCA